METYFTDYQRYPVALTSSGNTVTLAGGATVQLSADSAVTGTSTAAAFCLTATSPTRAGVPTQYYDSDGGGLNTTGCT
jgi:hypothetical protein